MEHIFDVIVIGAGHSGLEAAFACAHNNLCVGLITLHEDGIALVPCNPSVGGPAKGIVTREIDALGGMQGIAADACQLQMKLLNSSKGPGVWALRAQIDKVKYHEWFLNRIKKEKRINLIIDEVISLDVKNMHIYGAICKNHGLLKSKKVIITSGTFMNAVTHIGNETHDEGPQHLPRSHGLSSYLREIGFDLIRLKTGTPPRVKKNSIKYSGLTIEPGTNDKLCFSHFDQHFIPFNKQEICYLTYTNNKTHKIIKDNIKSSAMYSGNIQGMGPRYCPSIEDKIVRFSDKPRHQIFIEPESSSLDTMYLQGLSTSLPRNVQDKLIHSIKGLEKAIIDCYAYAIEYDAINPIQLWPSLESKKYKNLYCAGQVNCTSGYEEAACQGLMAGINATLAIKGQKPLILKRDEAYIGVLIDDLVTKGVTDPYRLLTSRAEHRLLLRNDNADDRLIKYGYKIGLVSKRYYQIYLKQNKSISNVIKYLKTTSLKSKPLLSKRYRNASHSLYDLMKRPELKLVDVLDDKTLSTLTSESIRKIEISIKFEGYIKNQQKNIDKFNKFEDCSLTSIKDYHKLKNLSLEARDKLNKVKPLTFGQAQRISGIGLTDLMVIKYYLDSKRK